MSDMEKDYLVTLTIKNNKLYKKIKDNGFPDVDAFCKTSGVNKSTLYRYLALKDVPLKSFRRGGGWKDSIIKISECLRCLPEDLFPTQHLSKSLLKNKATIETNISDIVALTNSAAVDKAKMIPFFEVKKHIEDRLGILTPRERRIIKMRFQDGMTLDECSAVENVNKERIRQIENKALGKMRHSKSQKSLNDYRNNLDDIQYEEANLEWGA